MSTRPAQCRELLFRSEAQTHAFAEALAPGLRPGDVVLLTGQVGAGKSVLARAIIQARMKKSGQIEDVPSPTYTLVQTYEIDGVDFLHSDLYRIGDISEVNELGLFSAFDTSVCLVEWADRLGSEAPTHALGIELCATSELGQRRATLTWSAPKWSDKLPPEAGFGHD